ncbi:MAG: serine/threonine protein kinase [Candidatus Xenobia bacterium]
MHQPGDVLQCRYEIETILGQGAMGRVYAARDQRFSERRVAIKQLIARPQDPQWDVMSKLFDREGRVLSDLQHPGLVAISDRFEESGHLYLVMDYVEGSSLQSVIEHASPTLEQVRAWARELCDVLEYLHTRTPPVVWRDLKPDNILVDANGCLRAIDFGLARFMQSTPSNTTAGLSLGTPGYAPFEQYTGQAAESSDVYALGATMYRMLTGKVPPPSPDRYSGEELRAPCELNPKVDEGLNRLVVSMLDMEAARRPTPAAVRAALSPASVVARPRVPLPSLVLGVMAAVILAVTPLLPPRHAVRRSTLLPTRYAGRAASLCILPDQRLVGGQEEGNLMVWDQASEPRLIPAHHKSALSLALAPDGQHLASASLDGTALLWDLPSLESHPLPWHDAQSVAFTSDRELAAGTLDGLIRQIDITSRHEAAPLVLPGNGPVGWMAVAPDGRLAAARDDGTLSVWNDTGDPVPWHASVGAVCSLAFSSKGTLAVGETDGVITLISPSGETTGTLLGQSKVSSLAFSADGQTLVSGNQDGTVRVWNVASQECRDVLTGASFFVLSVAISPDARRIVAAGNEVLQWEYLSGSWGGVTLPIVIALGLLATWFARPRRARATLPKAGPTALMSPAVKTHPFSKPAEQAIGSPAVSHPGQQITPSLLMLGLLRGSDSAAAAALAPLQVNVPALQVELEANHTGRPLTTSSKPFSDDAHRAIEQSYQVARNRGGLRITTLDLLNALLRDAGVGRVLRAAGVTEDALREASASAVVVTRQNQEDTGL